MRSHWVAYLDVRKVPCLEVFGILSILTLLLCSSAQAQVGQYYRPSHTSTTCGTDITAPVINQTLCFDYSNATNYVWQSPGQWNVLAAPSGSVGIVPPAGQIGGTTLSPTVLGLAFGATLIPDTSTAPINGQCLEYNGTGLTGAACSGGTGVVPPAGQIGGTTLSPTITGETFGATSIPNGTAPTTGQCLEYNGTNITGAACSSTGITCKGTGTLVGGMATVANACVTSSQTIFVDGFNDLNRLTYYALSAGVGFTVVSENPLDTSNFGWSQN